MSGFEIAGVVLGALPMIFEALDHYSRSVSFIKNGLRYEPAFNDLRTKVEVAWVLYRAACEHLLKPLTPLVISDQDYEELINNPTSGKWQDEKLNKNLRELLPNSYETYKAYSASLHRKLDKLRSKLELNADYLPPWIIVKGDQRVLDDEIRIQFFKSKRRSWVGSFNLDKCNKHIDLIIQDIRLIRDLIVDHRELEVPRRQGQKRGSSHWILLRDKAKEVFKSLEARWAHPCPCTSAHCASIQLLTPQHASDPEKCVGGLNIIFSFNTGTGPMNTTPWNWRDVEVISQEVTRVPKANTPTVRFSPATTTMNQNSTTMTTQTKTRNIPQSTKITSICEALSDAERLGAVLGYLEDGNWHHQIHQSTFCSWTSGERRLENLRNVVRNRPRRGYSTKEKQSLALISALTVLQLQGSPWVDATFGTKDIHFLTDYTCKPLSLIEDDSYITHTFVPNKVATPLKSIGRKFARNALVFALGVILLELSYGTPLLEQAIDSELDAQKQETPNTEFQIATRLLQDIRDHETDSYAVAASSCIKCDMGEGQNYSLDDEGFRAGFIERVLWPLEEGYEVVFRKK